MRYAKAIMSDATRNDFAHLPATAAALGHVLARPKALAAICVIMLTSLGWLYLALMLARSGVPLGKFGAATLQAICQPLADGSWSVSSIALVGSMWVAMTLMMMLPSAVPMILTYAEIAETAARKGEQIVSPFTLVAGYSAVWLGFSVAAAMLQIVLTRAALLDASMAITGGLFSGAIFIGAGAYQFSPLKQACLKHCQHPFPFFFTNWTTTRSGVFRLGIRQGLYCLGCCWAMMAVIFAVGVMNVIWMAGLGIVMTIEKLLTGRRFTHAVGVTLIAVGIGWVVISFTGHWPVRVV
jgi:predicted metal-binding membrane protein